MVRIRRRSAAYGSCQSRGKLTERVSHRSLDGAEERAAHRLHRPSSLLLIKDQKKPENGKSNMAEMAPDQAETSGSLRAIFDTDHRALRAARGIAFKKA